MQPNTNTTQTNRKARKLITASPRKGILRIMYTVALIFCMSAFASPNECSNVKNEHPSVAPVRTVPVDKHIATEQENVEEYSTFQFVKFLYI